MSFKGMDFQLTVELLEVKNVRAVEFFRSTFRGWPSFSSLIRLSG